MASFLQRIRRQLAAPERSMVEHPAVHDIVAGKLSAAQVRSFVAQQYLFTRTVPTLLCLRYAQVTDAGVRATLEGVMAEELLGAETGTDNHVCLHQKVAFGLGMSLEELEQTRPYPETRAVVYWQELVIRSRPWFLALGMKYGDEGQFAPAAAKLAQGLVQHYELSQDDALFYTAHIEADEDHSAFYENIIRRFVATPELQAELEELIMTAAEQWWDMWYISGQAAMMISSTSDVTQMTKAFNQKGWELGTGFFPRPDNVPRQGVIIGGGTLWLTKDHPPEELQAAWEFLKWISQPEQQVTWHKGTGYFPIRKSAMTLLQQEGWFNKFPNYKVAFDQLLQTKTSVATQGALIGVFPQLRSAVQNAIEKVYEGKATPEAALQEAAQKTNKELDKYNTLFQ